MGYITRAAEAEKMGNTAEAERIITAGISYYSRKVADAMNGKDGRMETEDVALALAAVELSAEQMRRKLPSPLQRATDRLKAGMLVDTRPTRSH